MRSRRLWAAPSCWSGHALLRLRRSRAALRLGPSGVHRFSNPIPAVKRKPAAANFRCWGQSRRRIDQRFQCSELPFMTQSSISSGQTMCALPASAIEECDPHCFGFDPVPQRSCSIRIARTKLFIADRVFRWWTLMAKPNRRRAADALASSGDRRTT